MTQPLISVIIPVYNVSKYVAQCLDSVLSQTYDNIEVLLIDDRGNDDSMDVIDRITNAYHGPKVVRILTHDINRGQSAARNTGTDMARGDYLIYIDSDDYLASDDVIDQFVMTALATGADIVCANSIMFDNGTGKTLNTIAHRHTDSYRDNTDGSHGAILPGTIWNMLIRCNFLADNDIKFDEGIFYEDDLWTFKAECCGYRLVTLSNETYMYRCRVGSTLNTLTNKHILSSSVLPLIAARWLTEHNTRHTNRSYAIHGLLNMMQGALVKVLGKTTDQTLFAKLYDLYRHDPYLRRHLTLKHIIHSHKLSRGERFRAIAYMLPTLAGRAAYRSFSHKIIRENRLGKIFNNWPLIDVDPDMIDRIKTSAKIDA